MSPVSTTAFEPCACGVDSDAHKQLDGTSSVRSSQIYVLASGFGDGEELSTVPDMPLGCDDAVILRFSSTTSSAAGTGTGVSGDMVVTDGNATSGTHSPVHSPSSHSSPHRYARAACHLAHIASSKPAVDATAVALAQAQDGSLLLVPHHVAAGLFASHPLDSPPAAAEGLARVQEDRPSSASDACSECTSTGAQQQQQQQIAQLVSAWREDLREKLLLKQQLSAGEVALQEALQDAQRQNQAVQERLMQQVEVAKLRMRIAEEGEHVAASKLKNAQIRVAELSTALMKSKKDVMALAQENARLAKELGAAQATISRLTSAGGHLLPSGHAHHASHHHHGTAAGQHLTFNTVFSAMVHTPANSLQPVDQAELMEAEAEYLGGDATDTNDRGLAVPLAGRAAGSGPAAATEVALLSVRSLGSASGPCSSHGMLLDEGSLQGGIGPGSAGATLPPVLSCASSSGGTEGRLAPHAEGRLAPHRLSGGATVAPATGTWDSGSGMSSSAGGAEPQPPPCALPALMQQRQQRRGVEGLVALDAPAALSAADSLVSSASSTSASSGVTDCVPQDGGTGSLKAPSSGGHAAAGGASKPLGMSGAGSGVLAAAVRSAVEGSGASGSTGASLDAEQVQLSLGTSARPAKGWHVLKCLRPAPSVEHAVSSATNH